LSRNFHVLIERDVEGFYVASVPALPGCHTHARSLDKLLVRIKEAIQLCRAVQEEADGLDFVGILQVTVEQ
jgi:predicted RNase H-like HicB family nuclease